MPRTTGRERSAKWSQIDSAYTEIKEADWKAVDDGWCLQNEEE